MKIVLSVATAALALTASQQTTAQSSTGISGQRLAAIEQEMFHDSNRSFIVIDLLLDGVMKPGDDCELRLDPKGVFYFRNKKLPQKLQGKYTVRINEFQAYIGSKPGVYFSILSGKITENDILDPTSSFRKPSFNLEKDVARLQQEQQDRSLRIDPIIGQMIDEHLIDTAFDYKLVCDEKGLFVNDKKLEGPAADKYTELFKEALHVRPDSKTYSYSQIGSGRKNRTLGY